MSLKELSIKLQLLLHLCVEITFKENRALKERAEQNSNPKET